MGDAPGVAGTHLPAPGASPPSVTDVTATFAGERHLRVHRTLITGDPLLRRTPWVTIRARVLWPLVVLVALAILEGRP